MPAGIDLEQHARSRVALPPPPMLGRAPPAGCDHPGCLEQAVHGWARELEAVLLAQHLAEVLLVEALVAAGGQRDHAPAHLLGRGVGRQPAAVAVGKSGTAPLSVSRSQATQLSHRQSEQLGRLFIAQRTGLELV